MKKLVFMLLATSAIWAGNIKTNNFIGIFAGSDKLTSNTSAENYIGAKFGYYFYEHNKYNLSNRVYLNVNKILKDNSSLYEANINLDWIFNQISFLKPFIGVNAGYLYDNDNNDNSTSSYGFNAGILVYLGDAIELEAGVKIQHPLDNSNIWPNNFKKVYGGINISF